MVELMEFSKDEIGELQVFLEKHTPHTKLSITYVLSDNPIDKTISFITVYRLILSCYNYASTKELKEKLKSILDATYNTYNEIFPLIMKYQNSSVEYEKGICKDQIIDILCIKEKNESINKIIDAYIVFGEKIELNRMDDYMGLDTENEFGKEGYKEIRKVIETEKI